MTATEIGQKSGKSPLTNAGGQLGGSKVVARSHVACRFGDSRVVLAWSPWKTNL